MNLFPDDIADKVLTQDSEVEQRCCRERLRIIELLRESIQKFKTNDHVCETHVCFEIEPKEENGTSQVRRLLSRELKERFPQLEYRKEPEKNWKPVFENGCDAAIYCVVLKKCK